ncbi:MAG TPA: 2OG-Fe(II) oxygenase family protein [Rhizomicrobium sp.]|nr:2OG-Fe(II) oxygenase family protein [Rhizomicrobium sp.]
MEPHLNPALDRDAFAQAYRRNRRVHIPGILTAESAARVHRCLEQETDFSLLTMTGADQAQAWRVAGLDPRKQAELMSSAYTSAREGFHYLYDGHLLSKEGEAYRDPAHYLSAVTGFLNSAAFLDFVRSVTGQPEIAFADAQATRYRPGHFLNRHDDANIPGRLAAYVLNLTPLWRLDWGGALLFSDGDGHISEGYPPAFNALNIFAVPQDHWVGFVAPFAGAARYSITGWFRAPHQQRPNLTFS